MPSRDKVLSSAIYWALVLVVIHLPVILPTVGTVIVAFLMCIGVVRVLVEYEALEGGPDYV